MHSAEGVFAVAFAGAAAFAATVPLGAARHVPSIVRAGLALSIAPLAAAHASASGATMSDVGLQACIAAASGASVGIGASIIAGAAGSAGTLVDRALSAGPGNAGDVGPQGVGPFGLLLPLVFANVMCSSGALAWLMGGLSTLSDLQLHVTGEAVASLAGAAFESAAVLAAPPLFAHALATLVAGIAARVAPRINGTLLAPALGSPFALLVVLAAVPSTFSLMRQIASSAAHAALHR